MASQGQQGPIHGSTWLFRRLAVALAIAAGSTAEPSFVKIGEGTCTTSQGDPPPRLNIAAISLQSCESNCRSNNDCFGFSFGYIPLFGGPPTPQCELWRQGAVQTGDHAIYSCYLKLPSSNTTLTNTTTPTTTISSLTSATTTSTRTTSTSMSSVTRSATSVTATSTTTTTATSTTSATHTTTSATTTSTTTATTKSTTTTTTTTTPTTTTTTASLTTPTTTTLTTTTSTTTVSTTTSSTTTTTTTTKTTTTTTTTATTTTMTTTTTSISSTTNTTVTQTTTVSTTQYLSVAALIERMESLEGPLVTTLAEDNVATVTRRVGRLSLVATKLDEAAVVAAGGSLTVPLEDSAAAVVVPASLFSSPGLSMERMALTIATLELTATDFTGAGGESDVRVAGVVNVNLLSLTGRRVPLSGLADPISVVIPVRNNSIGPQCVFWDEEGQRWATKGMKVGAVGRGTVECLSTHLTLFGVIQGFLNTFACSQVTLLNAESISEVAQGSWHHSPGAMLLWSVMATFTVLMLRAAWLDWHLSRRGISRDEHLLIPLQADPASQDDEQGAAAALVGWCRSSGALRDCIDEIASQWFEQFGEVRDLVEGLAEGLELCNCHALCGRFFSKIMALSARRQVASSLGISEDVCSLVMEHECVRDVVRMNRERQEQDVVPMTIRAREEVWVQLHHNVEGKLNTVMEASARWSSLPRAVWSLFLHHNPFSMCLVRSVFTTSKQRVLLFTVDTFGSMLLATLFFSATGTPSKRSRGLDCEFTNAFEFVGRLLALGSASVVVAGIPSMILGSLCTREVKRIEHEGCRKARRQLTVWHLQDLAIWTLGSLYVLFCVFFALLFLANVDEQDHTGWVLSVLISIVEGAVVIPLAMAMIMPLLAAVCLGFTSLFRKVSKAELVSGVHLQLTEDANMNVAVGAI